jgi:Tfp pilus assembly protein FimT
MKIVTEGNIMFSKIKSGFQNRISSVSGITMLELMIIVVIIGVVAAMAAPSFFNATPKLKARSEARQILNMIRLARSKAVSEGAQYGVTYNSNNHQLILFQDIVNPAICAFEDGDIIVGNAYDMDSEVSIASNSFRGGTVVFLPGGGASESGSVVFDAGTTGIQYTVSVLAATGRSKME